MEDWKLRVPTIHVSLSGGRFSSRLWMDASRSGTVIDRAGGSIRTKARIRRSRPTSIAPSPCGRKSQCGPRVATSTQLTGRARVVAEHAKRRPSSSAWCVHTPRGAVSVLSLSVARDSVARKPATLLDATPSKPHSRASRVGQSGWGDLFADKYEEVLDESTGEMIMVEKGAKKYKLDAQGNIINPPPSAEPAAAPAPSR